ncbi:response regulator transcription factor [Ktedonosporobacter rubrisoli]|uniref:Response regulator transcription factor n=1 Tax=Ktedonosporobacter rubrisoli TaxID=2509675 RepID=A0A4P6JJ32_KTERU|nr:response regulator transcription factor [Ktedonosporobacter rubrisoli]QBD74666.1 response regulator transcription factor [Ktedonosporobacter rubrisoli]
MSEPITILIVDDHLIVRQGVRTLLDMHPDLQVVGEAESAEVALPLVEELVPDVVLLDLILPGMNGVEATRQMKKISPRTQIVVLTSYAEDEYIFPALRAGALSYLLKDIRPRGLAESIRKAARGETVLHSNVAARMIAEVRAAKRRLPPAFAELTPRELDVLHLLAEGYTNASIAEKLVLSEKTVRGYISNVLSKLHLEDRTQAAVFAWQQGLMEQD